MDCHVPRSPCPSPRVAVLSPHRLSLILAVLTQSGCIAKSHDEFMGERVKSWTFGGANALDYFSEEGFKKFQDTVEEKGYTLE